MITCEQRPGTFLEANVETLSLKYIAAACGGRLLRGDPGAIAARVCTDSRRVMAGDVFIALTGEKYDGHNFLAEVVKSGVAAIVVQESSASKAPAEAAVIVVADTRGALGRLAAGYRQEFDAPIIAVGGSNGKTTTKELIASVLSQRYPTLKSEASFNNDVGVPLTLLSLEHRHEAAVLEVGTNHHGELAPLVRMIAPRYGVITSIGREHLEFFGDVAGVAQEEGWLAQLLPDDGKLFINGDTLEVEAIAKRTRAKIVRVGWSAGNDWRATAMRLDENGTYFKVEAPNPNLSGEYRLQVLGRHQVTNAMLALAVGVELGLGREELRRGLADCPPPRMRLNIKWTNHIWVLNDAYNANADSMSAALQTLRDFPCAGRRVAVLGDMAELGAQSHSAHVEVGELAARLGVGQLYTVGKMAEVLANAARSAGLKNVAQFADVESAIPVIKAQIKEDDVVLVKASRSARLERVVEAI